MWCKLCMNSPVANMPNTIYQTRDYIHHIAHVTIVKKAIGIFCFLQNWWVEAKKKYFCITRFASKVFFRSTHNSKKSSLWFWHLLIKSADLSKPWGRFSQMLCVSQKVWSLINVTMMSWVWVELRLFTTQFFDKVLPHTWESRKWEWNKFWEGFG